MKQHSRSVVCLYLFAALLLSLTGSAVRVTPVHAAGIVVNTNTDADMGADDGYCTLREAIKSANTDSASGFKPGECDAGMGADTITFAASYTITLAGSQLPSITTDITISGDEAAKVIVQAAADPNSASYRVIEVGQYGNLTLNRVTVRNGNVYTNISGGGIYNAGTLTVTNAAFLNNRALSMNGGAIYNAGTLSVTNSTFSGNRAFSGGGIYNTGVLTVLNSTFSDNIGTGSIPRTCSLGGYAGSGGIFQDSTGTAKLTNTILTGNRNGMNHEENCCGAITNSGNNLDSGTTCGWGMVNGSMSSIDPELLPLADNGGPTQTFAIPADSPARNTGRDGKAYCPDTDQRGVSRPRGSHCDIGAYEIAVPITQTFADVPHDVNKPEGLYWEDIEILYANGLTGGCSLSPLKFCPGTLMTRADAAVFTLRANFGSSYVPPVPTHIFKDNWSKGTWAEPWAEGMYYGGLSAGCQTSPPKYCPWGFLLREQLVVFGLRMKYGNSYVPPAATGTVFADLTDPNYYATQWAEQAYRDGLIEKCDTDPVTQKPKFCPDIKAPRGLAAYVIVRAKSLIMPPN